MSDTIQETDYPSLSESTDDELETPQLETVEEAVETPVPAAEEAPQVEAAVEETAVDDAAARAARLARDLREQKRRARQLELENQTLRGQRTAPPDEAMETEISNRAAAMAQQQVVNQKANDVYAAGVKEFGRNEFDDAVKAMNETFGIQMAVVIDTLTDIPDSQRLIQHLADNPDMLDNLAALAPHKLGVALANAAAKLNTPKVKPVSKAPPPIRPIVTQSSNESELDMEKMSMEQLAAIWDKRDNERRSR